MFTGILTLALAAIIGSFLLPMFGDICVVVFIVTAFIVLQHHLFNQLDAKSATKHTKIIRNFFADSKSFSSYDGEAANENLYRTSLEILNNMFPEATPNAIVESSESERELGAPLFVESPGHTIEIFVHEEQAVFYDDAISTRATFDPFPSLFEEFESPEQTYADSPRCSGTDLARRVIMETDLLGMQVM